MICLVALVTFSALGIFSAKYRSWAKEAFKCVFRQMTLRPCVTKLDQRIKMRIVGKLFKRSKRLGRFTYRHFNALSWTFTIVFFLSFFYSGYFVYNLATHGTCDPANPEGCVFGYEERCAIQPECDPCLCEEWGCESPEFRACGGICGCSPEVCG